MTERGATIGKRAVCTHSESVLRHHAASSRATRSVRSHSASAVQTGPPPAVEERDDEHVVCVDVVVDAVGEPLEKDAAHEVFLVTERESAWSLEHALEGSPDLIDQGLPEPRSGGIAVVPRSRKYLACSEISDDELHSRSMVSFSSAQETPARSPASISATRRRSSAAVPGSSADATPSGATL